MSSHSAQRRRLERVWPVLVEALCRAGYAARGFVYVSVGLIALLAALDVMPTPRGALQALEAWADWPLGSVLLWLTGLGLYGFAGWRALQSIFDADGRGKSLRALGVRGGQAVSGLLHCGLAIAVFGLIDAIEDLREVDDQADTRRSIEQMLAMPAGGAVVMAVGIFILGAGVGNIIQAAGRDFGKRLQCGPGFGMPAALLGRVGYAARGLVFLPVGTSFVISGWHSQSSEAKGAGAALSALETAPMGDVILAALAIGLMAFGLFAFVEARYRTLPVPEAAGGPVR